MQRGARNGPPPRLRRRRGGGGGGIFPGGAVVRPPPVRLKDAAAAPVPTWSSLSADFEAISCHAKLRFLVLTTDAGAAERAR